MPISAELSQHIEESYQKRRGRLRRANPALADFVGELEGDEGLLLRFYIAFMPQTDLINLDGALLLDFARESLLTRPLLSPLLPEEVWLNYVVWYRVNTESVVAHRRFFREKLLALGLSNQLDERILRVNEWCAEEVSYQSSDERTLDPLALWGRVYGRCGEESTFLVAALRSIGVAARQIYAPWWSHCDDNHAWVEVWTEEGWRFLGACEPEPVLNRGWFTEAASRALFISARAVLPLGPQETLRDAANELLINRTAYYAPSCQLNVRVLLDGAPAAGAVLLLEVFNYASYAPLAKLVTDKQGALCVELGLGSLYLICRYKGRRLGRLIHLQNDVELELDLSDAEEDARPQAQSMAYNFFAPQAASAHHRALNKAERQARAATILACDNKRAEKLRSLAYNQERAVLLEKLPELAELADALAQAGANFPTLAEFVNYALEINKRNEALAILRGLSRKDYADVTAEVLRDRLTFSPHWRQTNARDPLHDEELARALYSPRVENESLEPLFALFHKDIGPEQRGHFQKTPLLLMDFIRRHCPEDSGSGAERFPTKLSRLWLAGLASEQEKQLLFVALARFCHIPAKLMRSNRKACYYQGRVWQSLDEEQRTVKPTSAELTLTGAEPTPWRYHTNWILERWIDETGAFRALAAEDYPEILHLPAKLCLAAGSYRLNTANRLPSGNLLISTQIFDLHAAEAQNRRLALREAALDEQLLQIQLDPIPFFYDAQLREEGEDLRASLPEDFALLIWLDPLQEPSIHVLNELLEYQAELRQAAPAIALILEKAKTPASEAIARLQKALPQIRIFYGKAEEAVARQVYINPELLPRSLLVNQAGIAHFAQAGYQVGQVHLVLDLLALIRQSGKTGSN